MRINRFLKSLAANEYRLDLCFRRESSVILVMVLAILIAGVGQVWGDSGRKAAVYFSDGSVVVGRVFVTQGRRFKLNIPKAGTISTSDMVSAKPVKYGKVRYFNLGVIKDMMFYPEREEVRRKWRFTETTKYDIKTAKADYTPAAKAYSGKPYPLRYLTTQVVFNSGEKLQGHLYTTVIFVEDKNHRVKKYILRSKQRGKEGQTLSELIYIRLIKFLDKGQNISSVMTVTLAGFKLSTNDIPQAITRETLTPIPTKRIDEHTCKIESAFGDDVYMAVKKGNVYYVGWPAKNDAGLMKLAEGFVERQRDFYNNKKLLGAILVNNGSEMLTLLSLRRKVAPTNFGKIGGEWDKKRKCLVEPWRLSIWRWKYDKEHKELTLVGRGTFFRVIFLTTQTTPKVVVEPKLWNVHENKGVVGH